MNVAGIFHPPLSDFYRDSTPSSDLSLCISSRDAILPAIYSRTLPHPLMPQHTKEQLLSMSVDELKAIAVEMKTPNSYSDVKAQLVYDILDKQAEMSTTDSDAAPKRRRIASAPHDHVYSATRAFSAICFFAARSSRALSKRSLSPACVAE